MAAAFRRPEIELFPASSAAGQSDAANDTASDASKIRCLPDLVEFNASNNPDHLFCLQAVAQTNGRAGDAVAVTFKELGLAVDACCTWLRAHAPQSTRARISENGQLQRGRPVALFLESDVLIFIYLVALLKCNISCLLLSARLSPAAVVHLLTDTSAASILVSQRTHSSIKDTLDSNNITSEGSQEVVGDEPRHGSTGSSDVSIQLIASLSDLLSGRNLSTSALSKDENEDSVEVSDSVAERCVVEEDDRNVLILHSSGSTGLPKPIRLAHRYLLGYAACHAFPADVDESNKGINVTTLPLYHGFGLLAPCLSLSVGKACHLPPSTTIPNGKLIASMLQDPRVTSLMSVPSILEDVISCGDDAVAALAKLDFVAVGGGAMKHAMGVQLHSAGVALLNHYGATEIGALAPIFRPDDSYDWTYLRLRQDLGLKLENIGQEPDGREMCKLIAYPFGWGQSFELQDQLVMNPRSTAPEVQILGRKDDLVVLATGEKVLPTGFESTLSQNDLVKTAVVFGEGRFQLGVLIEPAHSESYHDLAGFVDSIWPLVTAANKQADSHAQISSKAAILIKPEAKVIPRSDKGAVQRKALYEAFKDDIENIFAGLETDVTNLDGIKLGKVDLHDDIRSLVSAALPSQLSTEHWDDNSDFFELGMDSLQATRLRRLLCSYVENTSLIDVPAESVTRDFVYGNPSVHDIATALSNTVGKLRESPTDRAEYLQELVDTYCERIGPSSASLEAADVLLTGSTGSLGAHLLCTLAGNPKVARVSCLVRSPRGFDKTSPAVDQILWDRQKAALEERGLVLSEPDSAKVSLIPWEPGRERLGLGEPKYGQLVERLTHIFHGAWPMNFSQSVQSFRPHLKTVEALIDLAQAAHRVRPNVVPKLIFASSIAVVSLDPVLTGRRAVPESIIDDPLTTLPMGYAEAKWVCEKMIQRAAESLVGQVELSIVRIGQLSGCEGMGYWSTSEHIPALLHASQVLGTLPKLDGSASWLPVNKAALVISDLLLDVEPSRLVYHVENPVRQSWTDILAVVRDCKGFQGLDEGPLDEWLDHACGKDQPLENLKSFFLDHFSRMSGGSLVLATDNTLSASPCMRSMGAVDDDTIRKYVNFWQEAGALVC